MPEHGDIGDDLPARGDSIWPLAGRRGEPPRLTLQALDALEEIERAQAGKGVHRRIDQDQNCDRRALLVLLQKVQREIDQPQEHEVGDHTVGVARKDHQALR